MSRVNLELVKTKYKELVDTCVERSRSGLDCYGCKYEDNCDDILKEVLGIERIYDR